MYDMTLKLVPNPIFKALIPLCVACQFSRYSVCYTILSIGEIEKGDRPNTMKSMPRVKRLHDCQSKKEFFLLYIPEPGVQLQHMLLARRWVGGSTPPLHCVATVAIAWRRS
jgi:hypothetical protein